MEEMTCSAVIASNREYAQSTTFEVDVDSKSSTVITGNAQTARVKVLHPSYSELVQDGLPASQSEICMLSCATTHGLDCDKTYLSDYTQKFAFEIAKSKSAYQDDYSDVAN